MMAQICQSQLPFEPWMEPQSRRLPGVSPVAKDDWLFIDDVYADQLAYRDALLNDKRSTVYAMTPAGEAGAEELLAVLASELRGVEGYEKSGRFMTRPDGAVLDLDGDEALVTAARLVQEDFAVVTQEGAHHCLRGGVICFPASWVLSEKIGRSLGALHNPVQSYTDEMNERVERIFKNLRPDEPVQRANFLIYTNPDLHQPLPEGARKEIIYGAPRFVRVERQTLRRLPQTGAVVFAIHTFVVPAAALSSPSRALLTQLRPELAD